MSAPAHHRLRDCRGFFSCRRGLFSARSGKRPVVRSGSCLLPARFVSAASSIGVRPGFRALFSIVLGSLGAMMKFLSGGRDFHGTCRISTMGDGPAGAHRAMAVTPEVNDDT